MFGRALSVMYNTVVEMQEAGAVSFNRAVESCYSIAAPVCVGSVAPACVSTTTAHKLEFSMSRWKRTVPCKCGCGTLVTERSKYGYCQGHNMRAPGILAARMLVINAVNKTDTVRANKRAGNIKRWQSETAIEQLRLRRLGSKHTPETRAKIGRAHKGRAFSAVHRERISQSRRGPKNWMWRGGACVKYPEHWPQVKQEICLRDNRTCMICATTDFGLKRVPDVHHIDFDKTNCFHQNLISLCGHCHQIYNCRREAGIPFLRAILTERYGYVYD